MMTKTPNAERAVSRKRRRMPADSFVRTWQYIAPAQAFVNPRLREAAGTL